MNLRAARAGAALLLAGAGAAALALVLLVPAPAEARRFTRCPADMASVFGRFCVDRYEASLMVLGARGRELRRHSPYHPVEDKRVRARSQRGVVPQAHINRDEAEQACKNAGKRLCSDDEWLTACRGARPTTFPYGNQRKAGYCNDKGRSPLDALFGGAPEKEKYGFERMNDPRLNQVPGTLAKTGAFARCRSSFGVYDMVGNLHEWTAARSGTFRGGYYLDTHINGDGCSYATTAHASDYHDYSTGFRCCADLASRR